MKRIISKALQIYKDDGLCALGFASIFEFGICYGLRNIHYKLLTRNMPPTISRCVNGYKMLLDKAGKGAMKDIIQFGGREFKSTELLDAYLKSHSNLNIIDIGANVGYYVLLEAKYGHTVYASEPELENFKLLEVNVLINHFDNVHIFDYAFGEKYGMEKLYISDVENYHSMLGSGRSCDVLVTTLDRFTEENEFIPDVIRMDVEGYEYEIIRGGIDTLSRMPKGSLIFVEIHPDKISQESINEIKNTLCNNGFRCMVEIKDGKEIDIFNYMWWRNKFPKLKRTFNCGIEYFYIKEK